jgi:hypothetical protein
MGMSFMKVRVVFVSVILLTITIGLIAGCSSKQTDFETVQGYSPEKLGKLGAAIDENPNRAEEILKKNNLTMKQFRKAVNRISSEPALSRRYHKSFIATKKRIKNK